MKAQVYRTFLPDLICNNLPVTNETDIDNKKGNIYYYHHDEC